MAKEDEFDEEPEGEPEDVAADETADISCPYCGEISEIALDPGGGSVQQYVEDCTVCCRPMRIRVRYTRDGAATVTAEAEDDADEE